jgi:hypothetical protein
VANLPHAQEASYLDTFELALILVLGIVLVIALFIQFRYLRPRKDDAIDLALNRDEAYNAMTTAQAVSAVLVENGRDTKEADRLLIEAELAYDRGDFLKCTDSSKRAKDYLAVAPMATIGAEPTQEEIIPTSIEPIPEQPKISEARKLPPNYLESKFMIETAADEIEVKRSQGKNVTASICLLEEAKKAFDCKDYDVALRKSLKAKKGAEASTQPTRNDLIDVATPAMMLEKIPPVKVADVDASKEPAIATVCAGCGSEARDDDNFCAKCGRLIERKRLCPNCQMEISEDDVFCRRCGTEIRAT